MVGLMMEPARATGPVDEQTTATLLAKAVKQRAAIYVRPAGEKAVIALSGTITGSEGLYLTLKLERLNHKAKERLMRTALEANIEIDELRYLFATRCTTEPVPTQPMTLHVHKPERMTLTDRRRSPRRHLRGRTEVSLSGSGESVDFCGQAIMLNLSPEGMACRLAEQDALRLEIGRTLRVVFRLGVSTTSFNLNAHVSNITKGGTPGHVVVGLAFITDEPATGGESNRTKLQQALKNAE